MSLDIIPYEPRYAPIFKRLNQVWIQKYFAIEPKDMELLDNCQESIIDIGGFIFFANYKNRIAGCFALIPYEDGYELGKMAVDERYQGLKIGQKLLVYAIDFAKSLDAKKIVLYSSRKLQHALYIYKKHGFKEVTIENNAAYVRSDIKMELELY